VAILPNFGVAADRKLRRSDRRPRPGAGPGPALRV